MQANNVKASSARAEAMEAAVKTKMPKCPHCKPSHFSFMVHPKLRKWIRSYVAKGHGLCQPKPKVQLQLRFPKVPRPL